MKRAADLPNAVDFVLALLGLVGGVIALAVLTLWLAGVTTVVTKLGATVIVIDWRLW